MHLNENHFHSSHIQTVLFSLLSVAPKREVAAAEVHGEWVKKELIEKAVLCLRLANRGISPESWLACGNVVSAGAMQCARGSCVSDYIYGSLCMCSSPRRPLPPFQPSPGRFAMRPKPCESIRISTNARGSKPTRCKCIILLLHRLTSYLVPFIRQYERPRISIYRTHIGRIDLCVFFFISVFCFGTDHPPTNDETAV